MRILPIVATMGLGLTLAGCQADSVSNVGPMPRQAITYAATAHYPGNPTTDQSVHAVAIADPGGQSLTIYNVGNASIPASTVWVNGHFVRQISAIPPQGSAQVSYKELIQAGSGVNTLSQLNQSVNKVEIQSGDKLYTVEGPAIKHG